MTPLALQSPGDTLGRYLVFDQIASGGMATVHFGRLTGPAGFSRVVAIKRLHAGYAKDPDFVAMMFDEARLAARIRHPNVVAMLDMVATGTETFLVMEYVHGESLARLWRAARDAGERVDPRVAATVMTGVLHGLHAAHEAQGERGESLEIVHRDVSPQNILVGADGVARVHDFGVAKAAGRVQTTREGRIKGKLAYMPPEQLHGSEVTRRADVYAAAVVTWELLTGKRAFASEHEAAIITAILTGSLPPPSAIDPEIPEAFDRVVLRGLHRDPDQRYATAREMALELERCVGVASMSEVADWVQAHAQEDLLRRSLRLSAIEASASSDASDAAMMVGDREETTKRHGRGALLPPGEGPVASRIAMSTPVARVRRRWRERVAVVASTVVGISLTAVFLIRALPREAKALGPTSPAGQAALNATMPRAALSPASPLAPSAPASSPPPAVVSTIGTPAPTSVGSAAAAPASARPGPSAPAAAPRSSAAPRAARSPGAASRPGLAKAKADCDPPFAIDDMGHKHYKAACLE